MIAGRRTICELFAGAGGAYLGAHRAGLRCLQAVEYDATAAACLTAATGGSLLPAHPAIGDRAPGVVRCMDVREWQPVPSWGWWASPPCQRHSSAGNGSGPDGFPMVFDALERAARTGSMPTWILAENVRGALTDGTIGEVVAELRQRFGHAGYWLVDCAELWLPQHRVRVVVWAGPLELPDLPLRYRPLTPAGLALGLWGALDGGRNSVANPTQERPRTTDEPAQTVGTRGNLMLDSGTTTERGGGAGHAGPWVVPCRTVSASESKGATTGYVRADGCDRANRASHDLRKYTGRRRLTVAECAALQGFPDGWPWQGTAEQRYRQVGNAVPPILAEWCWRHVAAHAT